MSLGSILLKPAAPFRLDLTVWTLRRRPDNAVDRWDGQTYLRVLPLPTGPEEVAITQVGSPKAPRLRVAVEGQSLCSSARGVVVAALERLLGLRIDMTPFYQFAARQGRLGQLARRFRGIKPPRFATVFESVVNAIACQQVTLTLGIRLLNALAANYGPALPQGDAAVHAFPRPDDLAGLRRFSPAMMWAPATTYGAGCASENRSTTGASGRSWPGGGLLPGSSTFTCCWIAWQRRAT